MESINIKQTETTPKIIFQPSDGLVEIRGDSFPENTFNFYKPLIENLEQYFQNPQDKTIINLELTYFNSSSSRILYNLFDILEDANKNCTIEINWLYDKDNENLEEAGEEFAEDFESLNINLVKIDII
jgi:hypothetical protein